MRVAVFHLMSHFTFLRYLIPLLFTRSSICQKSMVLGEVIDFKVYAIKKLFRFTADLLVIIF